MIGNLQFQTFFLSKEVSNCPLIGKAIELGKEFEKKKFSFNLDQIIFSLKYGKRVLINADDTNIKDLKRKDFLEIIDYDPLKKVMVLMGSKTPRINSSVHWLIHHARSEINAVIQINDSNLLEKLENKFPITEKNYPAGTLELAKEVLKLLRDKKKIIIREEGVLFVGNSFEELKAQTFKTLEELK